jgi:hypothetical protein
MIIDSPIISGSQNSSGPLTQIGNVQITGSLSVTGTINGSITGSVTSASYATTAEFLDGLDSTSFVFTSSFNTFSGSAAGRITDLEAFSSSLDATFATDASVTASILVLSGSVQASQAALSSSYTITSGSYASASGSLSIRTTNLEATSSTLVAASSSFAADSASLSTRLTGDEANITTLTSASGSFAAQSASLSTRITQDETNFTNLSSSFATTSGSVAGRVSIIEGQDATTGSNVFTGPQFISQASNAISFTSTASLYTDGGLRVAKDSFVSGTAYFNNITVYGTSSIQYITSSQLNIGTNIITVNTDTPAVRFGGLAVFDSGSTQLTGSLFWDSEKNHWIYSNPSGSSYNSAMLMNGPRNTGSLGSEQGTTSCAIMIGQGGDHITSSMIYSYGNATCFYGQSFISSSGAACFAGTVCAPTNLVLGTNNTYALYFRDSAGNAKPVMATAGNTNLNFYNVCSTGNILINNAADNAAIVRIDNTGAACFASSMQAGGFYANGSTTIGIPLDTGGTKAYLDASCINGPALTLVSDGVGRTIRMAATTGSTYSGKIDINTDEMNIGTNVSLPFTIYTNATSRLGISSTGIATFCCTVCAPTSIITGCAAIGGTSAPSSTLDITRSSPDPFNTVQCQLSLINGGGNGGAGTQLNFNIGNAVPFIRGLVDGANSTAGAGLVFGTANSAAAGTERMRISNTGCVGIGATSPQATLHICTVNTTAIVRVESACDQASLRLIAGVPGTARATRIDFLNGATCVGRPQWTIINDYNQNGTNELSIINCDPTTRVFSILQNGNIGIGTACPSTRLTVGAATANQAVTNIASTTGNNLFNFISNDTPGHAIMDMGRCTESGTFAAGYIRLRTDGDSWIQGGNVGIGTTAAYTKLQVNSGNISVLSSCSIGTDGASDVRRVGFGFKHPDNTVVSALINTTAAGTWGLNLHFNVRGGNAVMPTVPAITIVGADDSGNNGGLVGIGTCTPGTILVIRSGVVNSILSPESQVTITNTTSGNYAALGFRSVDSDGDHGRAGITVSKDAGSITGKMHFVVRADAGNFSNPMTILSGGNVGINTADPKAMLHVCGGGATLRVGPWFSTNDRDYIELIADGTNTKIISPNENFSILNPSGCVDIISGGSGGVRLTPGATSWAAISSDRRKKKNFETTQGLAELIQIEPVKYHFEWDNDYTPKRMGFIAQNILPLVPEMVSETTEKAEDGSNYLTITPDYILPVLVKSIQEQQCVICSQASTINILKTCLGIV